MQYVSDTLIHSGKYSSVYVALRPIKSRAVAVKIYHGAHQKYFNNELAIYTLPHMRHDNILSFIGTHTEVRADGKCLHQLLVAHMSLGSLNSYLKAHSVDWTVYMRMSRAIAAGLAFLHEEVERDGIFSFYNRVFPLLCK